MNAEQLAGLRGDFYAALGVGKRRQANKIARVLLREAPPAERGRWRKWTEVTRRGHDVRVGTFPAEVYAGRDLAELEHARGFLGDPGRVEAAVEQLKEAE